MKLKISYSSELKFLFNLFEKYRGDSLRIVGGAVRDAVLNKKINDFDLCTTFQPDKVLSMLKIQNIKCLETRKNFGTITAMINGIKFEITTLRKDVECDGRHTDVKFVNSYEVDSKRRDLTINALYMNKNKEVFDYNNGLKDLENGLIKFIGEPENRVEEDYLRILRSFRFYGEYGKVFDEESLKACIKHKDGISKLSKERITEEFIKILNTQKFYETVSIMNEYDILIEILKINNIKLEYLKRYYAIKPSLKFFFNSIFPLILIIAENELDNFMELFSLSNKSKLFIQKIIKYAKMPLNLKYLLFEVEDQELIKHIVLLNGILNESNAEAINRNVNSVLHMKIENFNLKASDLEANGFLDKTQYSKLIEQGKQIYINADCYAPTEYIIEELKKMNSK